MKDKVAILIPSCDPYSDVWPLLLKSFDQFWPDCPFKIYLQTNQKVFVHPKVEVIKVGPDQSWSGNLLVALEKVPEQNILIWMDDFFLKSPVKNTDLIDFLEWGEQQSFHCLKTTPAFHAHSLKSGKGYEIKAGSMYRTSLSLTLWRKEVLKKLLVPGESAWDFEIKGSPRSAKDFPTGFYASTKTNFKIINGVIKRVWNPTALHQLKAIGLTPDLTQRKRMTTTEHLKWLTKTAIYLTFVNIKALL